MALVQLDELELYYQRVGTGAHTLLALHPSTVAGNLFRWALPQTDKFTVWLPDQRGHGKTPNPGGNFHMPILVQDMLIFIEAMELTMVHAIGYSMGASVLLNIAVQQPHLFESLVLIGANHRPPTEDEFEAIAGPFEQRTGLAYEIFHPERGLQHGWSFELDDMAQITCPTAIISGDRDPVSQPEDALAMYRTLPAGQLLVVPQCGHFDYYTSEPVKTFLTEWYEER
jgi:pimeloyl-ACP methyl ester carboxylesterase